jgi:hypothetical protein
VNAPLCACGCGLPVTKVKKTNRPRGYVAGGWHLYVQGHFNPNGGRAKAAPENTTCTHPGCITKLNSYDRKDGRTKCCVHDKISVGV